MLAVAARPISEQRYSSSENNHLQDLRNRAIAIIAETDLVKAFNGKWNIIRNKLQLLLAQIAELSETPGSLQNSMCREIIHSISVTLAEAKELLRKCGGTDVGKLQMNSSLDGLVMNLNQHFQELELLKTSGLLREPSLLLSSSKTEAANCICRELLARLQIGNLESRHKALNSLLVLMDEDEKNVLRVVNLGGLPILVHMLDSSFADIREKAAAAVRIISRIGNCERLLVSEGCLPALIRIMESGTSTAKQNAASAVEALSGVPENARCAGTQCAVAALLDICQSGTPAAQAAAAGALRNLAVVPDAKPKFLDENAIPVLLRLCTSGTALAQEHAVDCLRNLTCHDDGVASLIEEEEGVLPLLYFWDRASTSRAQQIALGTLKNICSFKTTSDALISAGFIPRLLNALTSGIASVQQLAVLCLTEIASSMEIKRLLGEAGCITTLVSLLEARTTAEQEAAARLLSVLLPCDFNRRLFRREHKGIPRVVKLLDPSNSAVDKKYPISILLSLSRHPKCKKRTVAAGALLYLEQLVESDVVGAQKLLESLRRIHIWNIFSRT